MRICCPTSSAAEDNERGASEYHGAGGPLSGSDGRSRNAMTEAFLEACDQDGQRRNEDFNGAEQDGFGRYQVTQRDGRRCSTAVGYLHPAMSRPNLTVETVHAGSPGAVRARPRRRGAGRAAGRAEDEFRAEREVILCGGAYNSPQLLMLSGRRLRRAVDDAADPGALPICPRSGRTFRTIRAAAVCGPTMSRSRC